MFLWKIFVIFYISETAYGAKDGINSADVGLILRKAVFVIAYSFGEYGEDFARSAVFGNVFFGFDIAFLTKSKKSSKNRILTDRRLLWVHSLLNKRDTSYWSYNSILSLLFYTIIKYNIFTGKYAIIQYYKLMFVQY